MRPGADGDGIVRTDELEIRVHARHALTLSVEGARANDVEHGPAWSALGIAWDEPPDAFSASLWIDDCLPENGSRDPYNARAGTAMIEHGVRGTAGAAPAIAWANPDAEYPGAVTFESVCGSATREPSYTALDEREIGARLLDAWRTANRADKGPPRTYAERRTSLSGMRGKIGLAWRGHQWCAPAGAALSTCIAKREDSIELRGEAGIESLSQEAMRILGVPAARTFSRMFGDQQCVLSERADRYTDPETGSTLARHQEDFAQATSWPGGQKYEGGTRTEPRWGEAYALLARFGLDSEAETAKLTRMLAASWMLGHCDLHRKNVGFSHVGTGTERRIVLAPMYDVSSAIGTRMERRLAIGIARQQALAGIGPRQWLTHAQQCALDPERTARIVRDVVRAAPEAIATARDRVRHRDENRRQDAVDRRTEAMIEYARTRRRIFEEEDARRRARGVRLRRVPENRRATNAGEETS